MKWKSIGVARICFFLCTLFMALSSSAQPAVTNAVTTAPVEATGTNAVVVPIVARQDNFRLTFWLDEVSFLQTEYGGVPLWQYFATVLFILLSFYTSKLLDFLTHLWLKKWAARTSTNLDDLLLKLLHGPVKVIAFVVFLHLGMEMFDWPVWAENFSSKGLGIVVAVSITYMLTKLIDLVLGLWSDKKKTDANKGLHQQLLPVIRKTIKVVIIVVAALFTVQNVFDKDITSLIAFGSVGGLAMGLAAQDTLANLFGAVAVFVDRPFQIGDMIVLDNIQGTVESIGLRSTRVRNLDGHLITIPNKAVGNAMVTNITMRHNIKSTFNFGITYDTPVEKVNEARKILEEVFRSHPNTGDLIISFNRFDPSSLNLMVIHWWNNTDAKAQTLAMHDLNLEIKRRFDQAGIEFAFPTQTLMMKTVGEA